MLSHHAGGIGSPGSFAHKVTEGDVAPFSESSLALDSRGCFWKYLSTLCPNSSLFPPLPRSLLFHC